MTTMVSQRWSTFGINCVQCDNELIAPEWSKIVIFGAAPNATAVSRPLSRPSRTS
jgi:hypothetical protein